MERGRFMILAPSPAPLPRSVLLDTDITFMDIGNHSFASRKDGYWCRLTVRTVVWVEIPHYYQRCTRVLCHDEGTSSRKASKPRETAANCQTRISYLKSLIDGRWQCGLHLAKAEQCFHPLAQLDYQSFSDNICLLVLFLVKLIFIISCNHGKEVINLNETICVYICTYISITLLFFMKY